MTHEHDVFRHWIAAYVLGSLEPAERAEFERHLRECAECDRELGNFAAIPPLLRAIDPPRALDPEAVERVVDRARQRVAAETNSQHRSIRRWRTVAVAAGAAAVILAFLAFGPEAVEEPPERVSIAVDDSAAGSIHLERRGWGTVIDVELSNLPPRDSYLLWTVDDEGEFRSAGSWGATASGRAIVRAATATQLEQIERIVITSADATDVVIDMPT